MPDVGHHRFEDREAVVDSFVDEIIGRLRGRRLIRGLLRTSLPFFKKVVEKHGLREDEIGLAAQKVWLRINEILD